MFGPQLSFTKIVATPTTTSWSQAYNAGTLFAVLALSTESPDEKLNALGREITKTLEDEFFSLETKHLQTIKEAVTQAIGKVPDTVNVTLLVACLAKEVLYILRVGEGRILLKRGDTLGVLMNSTTSSVVEGASGHLLGGDILVLETRSFTSLINDQELVTVLTEQTIYDAAETFMPQIHETENGDAAALFIKNNVQEEPILSDTEKQEQAPDEPVEDRINEPVQQEDQHHAPPPIATAPDPKKKRFQHVSLPRLSVGSLSHKQRLYISIAVIVAAVLLFSILLAVRKRTNNKLTQEFNAFYPTAEQKYTEGQALESVNKSLAQSDYTDAQMLLKDNVQKFPENSPERQKIDTLLKVISGHIIPTSAPSQTTDKSHLLIRALNGSGTPGDAGKLSDSLTSLGYTVDSTGNADNYSYQGVTIRVKEAKKAYLDVLKKDLSGKYTITQATFDLPTTVNEDADIIIGK